LARSSTACSHQAVSTGQGCFAHPNPTGHWAAVLDQLGGRGAGRQFSKVGQPGAFRRTFVSLDQETGWAGWWGGRSDGPPAGFKIFAVERAQGPGLAYQPHRLEPAPKPWARFPGAAVPMRPLQRSRNPLPGAPAPLVFTSTGSRASRYRISVPGLAVAFSIRALLRFWDCWSTSGVFPANIQLQGCQVVLPRPVEIFFDVSTDLMGKGRVV